MEKIKIAFIIDTLNLGGTELQLVSLIKRLNQDKFEPYLICLRDSDRSESLRLNCKKVILDVRKLASYRGIKSLIWVSLFLRRRKIDILQAFFIDSNIFGVIAGTFGGVRTIVSSRRDLGFWYSAKLLWILKILDRWVDHYLVNSHSIKDHILEHEKVAPEKISVIYNGIDHRPFERINASIRSEIRGKLGICPEDIVIGIVSNLNRRVKRVDIFLMAAGEVYKLYKNTVFLVIGDGYLKGELMQLAKVLGVGKRTYFLGLQEDVIPYLASFDIAISTSDSEGFSNAVLEYMAAGIPLVATDVGGNKELIIHNSTGKLVPRGDYKALASEICNLIADNEQRNRMGEMARSVVSQKYSWDAQTKETESFYSSLMQENEKN